MNTTEAPPIRFADSPKELLDDSLDALRKKADFLSERVQRVKKEMRANLFGLTKNRQNLPSPSAVSQVNHSIGSDKPLDTQSKEGDFQVNVSRNGSNSKPIDLNPSTFGNQLNKKVEIGQFTALNTDRHLFYSFYARIEEMIRPSWEDRVSLEFQKLNNANALRPKGGWITRLDVVLDSRGKLIKVVLLKSSGLEGFDIAAIDAFQKAGFFPNPPREIVNPEGIILLKYIFNVF